MDYPGIKEKKGPRQSLEPRYFLEADYGSLCGDEVSELNEQLTCGVEPTEVVA